MVDQSVLTNGHLAWFAGPDTTISTPNWASGPTFTELQALVNHSAGIKVDGTDFGLSASDQVDDRSFADQAGAQSRGPANADGNIEVYTPGPGDTTSPHAQAYDTFGATRTRLALVQRPVIPQDDALAAGDEVNIFRIITDARTHNRNDASRTLGTSAQLQDNLFINYIVPSETPTAPAATVTAPEAVEGVGFIDVEYEGRNVTVGAGYSSSDEGVVIVTPGGTLYAVGAGTAEITVTVPGAADLAPIEVTVP